MTFRALIAAVFILVANTSFAASELTDAQVRQRMIQESIASYSGSCPCPYNSARNGSQCGSRSAYSKPGGASPLCYPKDISDAMVQQWRSRNK